MFSNWKSLPLLFNDVEVKLYHQENRGRCRILRIESDTGIKEDEIVAIVNTKGDFEVIYEVVGISGSGKKPIKIRFHPHILEAGKKNEVIQEALKRTTYNASFAFCLTTFYIHFLSYLDDC
uniref:Uncharacterized protein n=1 Tax=Panagrolaimus superbus TaxID=310955 RepID=A0A914Z4A2_9BILA